MCSLLCQRPLTFPSACTHSIGKNFMGVDGGKAIAAALKDTQITNLKYAAFTPDSPPVSADSDLPRW